MTNKEAIMIIQANALNECKDEATCQMMMDACDMAIEALEQTQWIPFHDRDMTEEEREYYPDQYRILDCKLPEHGQRILVAIAYKGHETVQQDEFYDDDGCYLDSGYDLVTEAVAWMPLPEPYKKEDE